MRQNRVKQSLREGGTVVGTFLLEFATSGIARVVAGAGADFAIFDMEHSGWTTETIRNMMATCSGVDLVPVVRVPAGEYHFLARVLDMGAMGVMVPMVGDEQYARSIVQSVQYPPGGRRGAAFAIAHDDYQGGDAVEKIRTANEQVLTIVQIETAAGLENVDRIAAVDGVDVLWVGQADMTNALGIPGQFEHPKLLEALDRVAQAAARHGKAAAYLALSVAEAERLLARGFRCFAYSVDVWLYQQALQEGVDAVRKLAAQV